MGALFLSSMLVGSIVIIGAIANWWFEAILPWPLFMVVLAAHLFAVAQIFARWGTRELIGNSDATSNDGLLLTALEAHWLTKSMIGWLGFTAREFAASLMGAFVAVPASLLVISAFCLPRWQEVWLMWRWVALGEFALIGLSFPIIAILTYGCYARRQSVSTVSALLTMSSLVSVALAYVWLGEAWSSWWLLATILFLVGGFLVAKGSAESLFQFRADAAVYSGLVVAPLVAAGLRGVAQTGVRDSLRDWPDPIVLVVVCYAVSALTFLLIHLSTPRRAFASSGDAENQRVRPWVPQWKIALLIAGVLYLPYQYFTYSALLAYPVAHVIYAGATVPIFSTLMTAATGQRVSMREGVGVAIVVAAIFVVGYSLSR